MSFKVRYTKAAGEDLQALYAYQLGHSLPTAKRARDTIAKATEVLMAFPFTCRKADVGNPFLRELVISFGGAGYVANSHVNNDVSFDLHAPWRSKVEVRHLPIILYDSYTPGHCIFCIDENLVRHGCAL